MDKLKEKEEKQLHINKNQLIKLEIYQEKMMD